MNPIKIRFALKEEAQKLILGNTQYYNRLSQMDIDWRARKADATLDDLEHPFHFEEASDFWDKMGENTDYVNAPEECLAVNFSYAIIFGMNYKYETPELIRSIISTIK